MGGKRASPSEEGRSVQGMRSPGRWERHARGHDSAPHGRRGGTAERRRPVKGKKKVSMRNQNQNRKKKKKKKKRKVNELRFSSHFEWIFES